MSATGEKTDKLDGDSGVWDEAVPLPTVPGNGSHMTDTTVSNQRSCGLKPSLSDQKKSNRSYNTVDVFWNKRLIRENPSETDILISSNKSNRLNTNKGMSNQSYFSS